MLMSSLLLIVLVNPYYLRNLIEFLAYQYSLAANAGSLWDNVMPNVLTLGGWSEVLFGPVAGFPLTLLSNCGALPGRPAVPGRSSPFIRTRQTDPGCHPGARRGGYPLPGNSRPIFLLSTC